MSTSRHRGVITRFYDLARCNGSMTMPSLRPYLAAFRARFLLMLQYRVAALAALPRRSVGALHIMVFAAF